MNKKEIKIAYKEQKRSAKLEYKSAKREYKSAVRAAKATRREEIALYRAELGRPEPKNPPKRPVLEEIGNAVTHGVGSVCSVVFFILMLIHSKGTPEYVGTAVYFFGSFVMFTMSCLYHAFPHGSAVKRLFRRFDYSSIYLLIGATFAPLLLAYVGGTLGTVFFVIQWVIIVAGITFVGVFGPTRLRWLHIPMYLILGWSGLMLIPRLISAGIGFPLWILIGGVVYSLGIIPFALKRGPSHFIWHFFVLAGWIVQWVGIYIYIYLA